MSDTYNILKKYAYLHYDPDAGRPVWLDGEAPIPYGYAKADTDKAYAAYTDPFGLQSTLADLDPHSLLEKVPNGRRGDAVLIANLLYPSTDDGKRAFSIYNRILRNVAFNKHDDLAKELETMYPGVYQMVRDRIQPLKDKNPRLFDLLAASGNIGENLIGSELDYYGQSMLLDTLSEQARGLRPSETSSWDPRSIARNTAINSIRSQWTDAPGTAPGSRLQEYKNAARERANSYAFSQYVPSMLTAGLAPAAIGAFIGRPFLGLMLGALLSGGVGYYGYNRLYNPNFQGSPYLDKWLQRPPKPVQPESQTTVTETTTPADSATDSTHTPEAQARQAEKPPVEPTITDEVEPIEF